MSIFTGVNWTAVQVTEGHHRSELSYYVRAIETGAYEETFHKVAAFECLGDANAYAIQLATHLGIPAHCR